MLTHALIRAAVPPDRGLKKISDGGGLHLVVTPAGGKIFMLAYRHNGHSRTLSLGAYPAVSLYAARAMRDYVRALLAQGVDPNAKKDAIRELGADAHLRRPGRGREKSN